MIKHRRFSAIFIFCMLLPVTAYAQLCIDIYENLFAPTLSCSDAFYIVDSADGGSDINFFFDADTDVFSTVVTEETLIDELSQRPKVVLEDFYGENLLKVEYIEDEIAEFSIQHRGNVSLKARDSKAQNASFGNRSKVTFRASTLEDLVTETMILAMEEHLALLDPCATTGGTVGAGVAISLTDGETGDVLFDFNGLAQLDLEFGDEPVFTGDFIGTASAVPSGPGILDEFDITFEADTQISFDLGKPLILEAISFSSAFTDGFEPGCTTAWNVDNQNTFLLSVSSDNPKVRFTIVSDAISPNINPGMNDAWVSADAPFQGMFFTVFPDTGLFFMSWFTFDSVIPGGGASAAFGAPDQRWVTGLGAYSENKVTINLELTSGGAFNTSLPLASQQPNYGTIDIVFLTCNRALLSYNIPSAGLPGQMTLTRVLPCNAALCEELSSS